MSLCTLKMGSAMSEKIQDLDIASSIKKYKSFPYSNKFNPIAKNIYYTASDKWRIDLANRYDIDYFIFRKKFIKHSSKLPVVYENKHFIIYSIN